MPAFTTFVEAAWAYVESSAIAEIVVNAVVSLAVGFYEQSRAKAAAERAYKNSLQDRLLTLSSGVGVRGYVLGTARVSGAALFLATQAE